MTYIKHNGEWKRTTGVTLGQGDNTIVLSPGGWGDGYEPTITFEGSISKRDPSAQYALRITCGSGKRYGYANFAWGSDVRRKKARIFYRCYIVLTSFIGYSYDGNRTTLWTGAGNPSGSYYSSYFDVDDLSKLENIEVRVSDGTITSSWIELYVIELI